jgi:hypothetical protein
MSRSYRKSWITDGYKGSKRRQYNKRQANHIVRKADDVPDGKAYRKFYNPWDICDYRWFFNPNEEFYRDKPWRYLRK